MFPRLVARISAAPRQSMYLAGALVLILCQLSGIGALARQQIEKAERREAAHLAQRDAVLRCLDSGQRTRIDLCRAAQASVDPGASDVHALPGGSGLVTDGVATLELAWRQ